MLDEVLARLYLSTTPQDGIIPYLLQHTKYSTSNLKMGNFVTPLDSLIATATFGHQIDEGYACGLQGDEVYHLFNHSINLISDEGYLNYMRQILQLIEDQLYMYSVFLFRVDEEINTVMNMTQSSHNQALKSARDITLKSELCDAIMVRVTDMLELLGERHAQVIYDALVVDDPGLFEEPNLLFPVKLET